MHPDIFRRTCNSRLLNRVIGCSGLVLITLAGPASAQQSGVTLQGRVLDGGSGAGVAGADVEIADRPRVITGDDGLFRFTGVPPGAVTLRVRMIGYESRELGFELRADTAIVVELEPAAFRLDPLEATAHRIDIDGRVTSGVTKLGLDATVSVLPGTATTTTNGTGRYGLRNVPVADSSMVSVTAFGYLPQRAWITDTEDTTLDFVLERDPITERRIEIQLERLASRVDSVGYPVEKIYRDEVHHNGNILDVLRIQYGLYSFGCVMLDERHVREPDQLLSAIPSDDVHAIEIIDRSKFGLGRSAAMIRIYRVDFVRRMVAGQVELGEISHKRASNNYARCH